MSKPIVTLEDEEKTCPATGANSEIAESSPNMNCNDLPHSIPDRLNLEPSIIAREISPSPSNNGTSLLSLPWEIVTQIASHLPAQCVINVLPQVCQALGRIGEDHLVWQLRAHKLSGRQTSFPVGPKDDFDWSKACLEMEQLIGLWTTQEDHTDRQEQREVPDDLAPGAAGEVDGEVQAAGENPAEMQMDVELNCAAEVGDENMAVSSQNDPQGMEADPTTFSSSSSPLEHIVLPSGHIADVNCVLLLGGEGALCASGSRDRNVNLWDLRQGSRGMLVRTLSDSGFISTHRGWVWCLASSGPLLASGSLDSTIRLWDLAAGGAARGLIRCKAAVLCLSCEGDTVLAGSHDQKISIYDTRSAEPLVKSLRLHSDAVLCLASDDQFILSGSKDQTVALYDRRAGKLLQKVKLSSYLLSMSYSGREVWGGDNRGLVHTLSLHNNSLTPVSQFNIHSAMVTGIHYSHGTLYTCSSDRTVKVHLPSAPPKTLRTLRHQVGVNRLSVEAETLAIASVDMNVEVWRPRC
ncbi:F-box/WD repeat-containing protein 9 [Triplophysa dalaica]|uniref:F-box/WD repeat-containing protein 9 n=1 Tax=Triplophysa dalaica TaxID=1582913 RepID=UPI0024DF51AE|nr:F-box/WD repeat-containing protein 9 [Triplophysa dalaica]